MTDPFKSVLNSRTSMIGLGLGAAYGIVARLMFSANMLSGLFSVVTLSFTRVSTHFNLYAGWWAGRIMASIQNNILRVHKARAEGTSPILARAD